MNKVILTFIIILLAIVFCYCLRTVKTTDKFPNAISPPTKIGYKIDKDQYVCLVIYDEKGKSIDTLVNGMQIKGSYYFTPDFSEKEDGVYFFRLTTEDTLYTKKMILMK
jgi:hypothetical protein